MRAVFRTFASRVADRVGSPAALLVGLGLIVVRAITGPFLG